MELSHAERMPQWTRTSARGVTPRHLVLERGLKLACPEMEEAVLVRPDLLDAVVIEPGVGRLLDRVDVSLDVGPDRCVLCRLVEAHVLRGRFEVRRTPQLLRELAAETAGLPQVMRELA